MAIIKPELRVLDQKQKRDVHALAVQILEKTGIRVDDPSARQVFGAAGNASHKDGIFTIPGDLVNWAVDKAPTSIDIFRRDGRPAFCLDSGDSGNTVFGIGVTNLYYQEPRTDNVVPFGRSHMVKSTLLVEGMSEFDAIATPGVIQDLKPQKAELIGSLEMLANTTKPIVMLVSETDAFETSLDMYAELIGFEVEKPYVIPYVNPITPLVLNSETTTKMDITIDKGLPLIFSNYGMAGATTPITPSGSLALMTAELLAGLVYSQLKKEGTPIILGSLASVFDMKSTQSYYTPQSILLNLACAEMMAYYGIPHCGTSGGSLGWGPDLMASGMLWANHLTGAVGRAGLTPFVGSNFDSLVFSPATAVYAAEVIRFAREFSRGFTWSVEELGMQDIQNLGPGGNYLLSDLTLMKFKDQSQPSGIWEVLDLEKWQGADQPEAIQILRDHTHHLINEMEPPSDHDRLLAQGELYIQQYLG